MATVLTITEESEGISLLHLMVLLTIEIKMIKNQKRNLFKCVSIIIIHISGARFDILFLLGEVSYIVIGHMAIHT